MKIAVMGAGAVGSVVARDLAAGGEHEISVFDASEAALTPLKKAGFNTQKADLSDPRAVRKAVRDAELAVECLPGRFGFAALKAVLEEGRNVVDVSFMPEDPLKLAPLAKKNKVTAIVDMGVAPGMSNLIVGYEAGAFDEASEAKIYVGGLPAERTFPFQYKAPFSPHDVIEEYIRPARYRISGQEVVEPPLAAPEYLEFTGIGTLEAFLTDGLRSLLATLSIPTMVEKTLRYPGYAALIRKLRECGFFSETPVRIGGAKVRPLDFTSQLLIDQWRLLPGEREFTVMRIEVSGVRKGRRLKKIYDLLHYSDEERDQTSMAQTTGFPCAIAARMLAEGRFKKKGLFAPEILGADGAVFNYFMRELTLRGVHFGACVQEM